MLTETKRIKIYVRFFCFGEINVTFLTEAMEHQKVGVKSKRGNFRSKDNTVNQTLQRIKESR